MEFQKFLYIVYIQIMIVKATNQKGGIVPCDQVQFLS